MHWRDNSGLPCRDKPTALFFDPDLVETARKVCAGCPCRVECLDAAIAADEQHGVWGQHTPDERGWLRPHRLSGPQDYAAALKAAFDRLDGTVPVAQVCGRCGEPMARTRSPNPPADRNRPNAQCGKVVTYNHGCRCVPCVQAKRETDRERNRRKNPNRKSADHDGHRPNRLFEI